MSSPSTIISRAEILSGWATIYGFLGLNVGVIVHGLDDNQRRQAYAADITYGTNNEFGLRLSARQYEIRHGRYGAARPSICDLSTRSIPFWWMKRRTPLIISGPSDESVRSLQYVNALIPGLARTRLRTRRKAAHCQLDGSGQTNMSSNCCAMPAYSKRARFTKASSVTLVPSPSIRPLRRA